MITNLDYTDVLQVFMQKVMLTQNEIEKSFGYPVQYEVNPTAPAKPQAQAVPQEETKTGEIPKPKITPLHIILGVILLL